MVQFQIFDLVSFRVSILIIIYYLLKFQPEREEKTLTIQVHLLPLRCKNGVEGILGKESHSFRKCKLRLLRWQWMRQERHWMLHLTAACLHWVQWGMEYLILVLRRRKRRLKYNLLAHLEMLKLNFHSKMIN